MKGDAILVGRCPVDGCDEELRGRRARSRYHYNTSRYMLRRKAMNHFTAAHPDLGLRDRSILADEVLRWAELLPA